MEKLKSSGEEFNLRQTVTHAQTGDEQSTNELAVYMMGKFLPFFHRRNPSHAEDLAMETTTKIIRSLGSFDPTKGKGSFEQNFNAWGRRIAFNHNVSNWRREARIKEVSLDDTHAYEENTTEEPPLLDFEQGRDMILEILSPAERTVVSHLLNGASYQSLPELLSSNSTNIKVLLHKARRKIEEKFLFPSGYRRASQMGNRYEIAASRGRISSLFFLNLHYITERQAKNYGYANRTTDPDEKRLTEAGYLLLSDRASRGIYGQLMSSEYNEKLVKVNGKWFILSKDLEEFERKHKEQRLKNYANRRRREAAAD